MDDTTTSRRGRPPAPTPTMPLFLGAARTRVKEEVVMSGTTAREMRAYVDWAGGRAMMPEEEALIRTLDHALMDYFRNDKAWQIDRSEFIGPGPTASKGSGKGEPSPPAPLSGKPEGKAVASPTSSSGKAAG